MKKLSMSLALAIAAIGAAHAQVSGTNTTAYGSGTLRVGATSESLRQATVVLKSNGRFEVAVYPTRGDVWRCDGRFTRRSSTSATLDIRDGTGNAKGSGTVLLGTRQRLQSLDLSGTSRGGGFSIKFDADMEGGMGSGRPGSGSASGFEINASREGSGRIRIGGNSGTLSKAYVELKNNGDAQIKVFSTKEYEFKGNWVRSRGGYDVEITSGIDSSRTRAKATIDGSGGSFRTINMTGTDAFGDSFSVAFVTDRNAASDIDTGGDNIAGSYSSRGEGSVKILLDERDKLKRGEVRLHSNGTFQATLEGGKRWTFGGTWRRRNANEVTLSVTTSNQDARVTGSGTVSMRAGNLNRIEMSVRMNDRGYTVRFQAN